MKNYNLILFIILCSFISEEQEEYIEHHENGSLKLKSQAVNNFLEGAHFEYDESGNNKNKRVLQ